MSLDNADLIAVKNMIKDMIENDLQVEISCECSYHYDEKSVDINVRLILDGCEISYTSTSFGV